MDLTKDENELLAGMHSKTRYNIRLSQRHGVEVIEDNSDKAYETFIKLFFETTKRQGFYGHTPDYYRKMKEVLVPAKIEHLFLAKHKGQILATYIFFIFKDTLYYLYGGSSREHHEVMPTYAIFWYAIKQAKAMGLKKFDLWAALGPKPNIKDPWYGFHRFKAGFGGKMIEFIGTYDLINNPLLYLPYQIANAIRWQFLKLKTHLPF
jgi:lipid II:glycine glycyltransferase (peptidoglycan interpeptide bridge formation enzyme)